MLQSRQEMTVARTNGSGLAGHVWEVELPGVADGWDMGYERKRWRKGHCKCEKHTFSLVG